MEEKRPGQHPEAAIAASDARTAQRTSPPAQKAPSDGEDRDTLAQAGARAENDREAMRASGFGDHKGEEGF